MPNHLQIWRLALDLLDSLPCHPRPEFAKLDFEFIWRRMAFCILSSSVRYEVAVRAHDTLFKQPNVFRSSDDCADCLLTSTKGRLRLAGYRFPNTRAQQLVSSWFVLQARNDELGTMLLSGTNGAHIRNYLVSTFPGVGLKQASMLLRDLGISRDLAIVDSHILSFLNLFSAGSSPSSKSYVEVESLMRTLADSYGITVAELDLAIWAASKVNEACINAH